ncbi:double-stranded RNA-specific editase 1-like isoform X2 [Bombus vosnesenskii]|uniref:Double-stranded RNA-specific editase 1-like isoform X2 n=2 Tax=Pyrobombus TaxID=144703 RepID=A0A6J3KLI9_9HYME|nr:double-stranded RNA-specific editase 1-like isoform X3 [Bombus vancouverensis nearcticus]XP_033307949.1 double-stranded RNA-specific editase 1-like isoform X3 [Bombus bifarius]XP_033352694.1 double-stranded RNA-specific editase 1-like isoform X2 [Bombus vosnesenskii]XP_050487558.1 double-stranded RNA-specific editase 1-like isoform X6 [Bombus huntii]
MYPRNRQSQGYPNMRNQSNPNVPYQGQSTQQQQQQQPQMQQVAARNLQHSKSQQPQMQQVAAKNLQQGKPQQQQQQLQQQIKQPQQSIANSSQSQAQPQPQSQSQQQSQPQPQTQSQSQFQPQIQRLKPILKLPLHNQQQSAIAMQNNPVSSSQPLVPTPTSPLTTNSNPTPPTSNSTSEVKNENQVSEDTDTKIEEQLPRWRRKAPGFRVNKRLKRLRLNQRLRKTLQPKNAIMVLNEMKPGVQFTFPETQGPMPNSLYLVHAELDGKTYVGQGLSKPLARQNAAENALKALLLEKMTAASMKARIDAESDGQSVQSMDSSTISKEENNEEGVTPMDTTVDESDEIPWSSLASFALYKLFLEWHNQGTSVPVPRPGLPSPVKGIKREISHVQKTPVQKELPPNATNIHPVMLLNQMRPGLTYVELNRVGNPPNTMFTLAVDIDGIEYSGTAKNKKDAKKIAAKSALFALYGLNYPDEASSVMDQPIA